MTETGDSGMEKDVQPSHAVSTNGTANGNARGHVPLPAARPEEIIFRVSTLTLVYRYLFLGLLTLFGIAFLYLVVPGSLAAGEIFTLAVLLVWILALLRYWLYLLDMPYRIVLRTGEPIEFRSILRKRTVSMEEIRGFRVSPVYPSFLRIQTTGRKTIPLVNHVTGLHELIGRVKQVNPDLQTKGC